MKIKPELEDVINRLINLEWQAAYGLLAMSAELETSPFKGFAKWMLLRSEREQAHATQLFEYLRNRFGELRLEQLDEPRSGHESLLHLFREALELKQRVTATSQEVYELAVEKRDLETQELLHDFFREQVHEEKHIQDAIDKLELAGDYPDALIHLDYKEELQYQAGEGSRAEAR